MYINILFRMKYIYYFSCLQLVQILCLDGNLSISNRKLQSFFNERGENENISQLIFYTCIERKLLFQQMKSLRLQLQGPSSHPLWLKNRNDFFKIINKARLVTKLLYKFQIKSFFTLFFGIPPILLT